MLPMSRKRPRDPVLDLSEVCGAEEGLRERRGHRAGGWEEDSGGWQCALAGRVALWPGWALRRGGLPPAKASPRWT